MLRWRASLPLWKYMWSITRGVSMSSSCTTSSRFSVVSFANSVIPPRGTVHRCQEVTHTRCTHRHIRSSIPPNHSQSTIQGRGIKIILTNDHQEIRNLVFINRAVVLVTRATRWENLTKPLSWQSEGQPNERNRFLLLL